MSLTIGLDPTKADTIALALACDAPGCAGAAVFCHPDGYIGAHRQAMTAGWMDTVRSSGRVFLCPACSGKLGGGSGGGEHEPADEFGQVRLV